MFVATATRGRRFCIRVNSSARARCREARRTVRKAVRFDDGDDRNSGSVLPKERCEGSDVVLLVVLQGQHIQRGSGDRSGRPSESRSSAHPSSRFPVPARESNLEARRARPVASTIVVACAIRVRHATDLAVARLGVTITVGEVVDDERDEGHGAAGGSVGEDALSRLRRIAEDLRLRREIASSSQRTYDTGVHNLYDRPPLSPLYF
jgi:hypothetical protein